MRKCLIILLVGLAGVGLLIAVDTSQAAFWSRWFKKKTPPAAAQKKIPPPAQQQSPQPKPVDIKDVERRVAKLQQIFTGTYLGPKAVEVKFNAEELNALLVPLANQNIKRAGDKMAAEVKSIKITDGAVEISGRMSKPVKGDVVVQGALKVEGGGVKIDILKLKIGVVSLPRALAQKMLAQAGRGKISQPILLPNFQLIELALRDGVISIKGNYSKK